MNAKQFLLHPLLAATLLVLCQTGLSGPAEALSPAEPPELIDLWEMVGDREFFFGNDSAKLRPDAIVRIEGLAKWMKRYPDFVLMIEGHADNRGSREYNLELGCRRALATRDALTEQGIAPKRLGTVSYGKERPSALGENGAALAKNRRAVFLIADAVWTSDCPPPGRAK